MPRAPDLEPPEDSGAAERLRQFEESRGIEPDPGIPPFPQDEDEDADAAADAAGDAQSGTREADATLNDPGEGPTEPNS
jgi:hypothetical protein